MLLCVILLCASWLFLGLSACSESYISYSIETKTYWKTISSASAFSLCDDCSKKVGLPFSFDFYGNSFNQISISSNGYLSFLGNANLSTPNVTGESIWVWWLDYYTATLSFSYDTVIDDSTGYNVFVIEFYGLTPKTPAQIFPGPDLCSSNLIAQVRLYEYDYSIEIEIYEGPVLWDHPFLSGIHSDLAGSTIYTVPHLNTTTGPQGWNGPLTLSDATLTPDPAWSSVVCPFPFASRFVCVECYTDSDCDLGTFTSIQLDCDRLSPKCMTFSGDQTLCEHPNQRSPYYKAVTAHYPLSDYVYSDPCDSSYRCCIFGAHTYLPPYDLAENCLTSGCLSRINSYLCYACDRNPPVQKYINASLSSGDIGIPVYFITTDDRSYIESGCELSDPVLCGTSVFDWPGFPFIVPPSCKGTVTLTEWNGTITDGSGPYDYVSGDACYWTISTNEVGFYTITINEFDLDVNDDDSLTITVGNIFYSLELALPFNQLQSQYFLWGSSLNWDFDHYYGTSTGFNITYQFQRGPTLELLFIFSGDYSQTLSPGKNTGDPSYIGKFDDTSSTQVWRLTPDYSTSTVESFDPTSCLIVNYVSGEYLTYDLTTTTDYYDYWAVSCPNGDGLFLIQYVGTGEYLGINNQELAIVPDPFYWNFSIAVASKSNCNDSEPTIEISLGSSGYISDGSGPELYPYNPNGDYCTWEFTLSKCTTIEFSLLYKDIDAPDSLEVYDDDYNDFYFDNITTKINVSINCKLYWYAGSDYVYQGWNVTYRTYYSEGCLTPTVLINDALCNFTYSKPNTSLCQNDGFEYSTQENIGAIIGYDLINNDDIYCDWYINIPHAKRIILSLCNIEFPWYHIIFFSDNKSYYDFYLSGDTHQLTDGINYVFNSSTFHASSLGYYKFDFKLVWTAVMPPEIVGCNCDQGCYQLADTTWRCVCDYGYEPTSSNTCADINECAIVNCTLQNCTNTPGSYICRCNDGYVPDVLNTTCYDFDECSYGTDDCEQQCINIPGSFNCSCNPGYILNSDYKTCSALGSSQSWDTASNSVPSFCTFQNISLHSASYEGSRTKNGSRCQFPFVLVNTTYYGCTIEGYNNTDPQIPWCATIVDNNRNVLSWDYCLSEGLRTNIAQKSITISNSYDDSDVVLDSQAGRKNPFYLSGSYPNGLWVILPTLTFPTQINIFGCPTCYDTSFDPPPKFEISVSCFISFSATSDNFHELTMEWDSQQEEIEIYLPGDSPCRIIEITSYYDLYLTEVQIYDNSKTSASITDCTLKLSRNYYVANSVFKGPFISDLEPNNYHQLSQSSAVASFDSTIANDRNFKYSVSFSITPHSSDIFSIIFHDQINTSIPLQIDIDPTSNQLTLIIGGHASTPVSIGNLVDDLPHLLGIVFVLEGSYPHSDKNGQLSIYLDSTTELISTQMAPLSYPIYPSFQCSGPHITKRQSVITSNEYRLYYVDISLEKSPSATTDNKNNTGIIVGVVVAILAVILIIIIAYFVTGRERNRAVELLPDTIKKHYIHFSRHPLSWQKSGHDASISYLRELEPNTSSYNKMQMLWNIMGGSHIDIEQAFAVFTPHQLINFANKWASTMTQVKNNPKLFINKQWQENGEELRIWVHTQYTKKVSLFNWNDNLQVPIIPALHGTDETVAYSIITTSFVALAKGDAGYYGKGLYFTTSAEYALPYYATKPSPTVLICFLITGNSYPVIEHPRGKKNLMGSALMPNFHSHYVLCRIDGNPVPRIMDNSEEPYYDEIVIEQESAVVPYYLLKISKSNLLPLAMDIQKRQEQLRQADELTRSTNIRDSEKSNELNPREVDLTESRKKDQRDRDDSRTLKNSRRLRDDDLKASKKRKDSNDEEELSYTRIQ